MSQFNRSLRRKGGLVGLPVAAVLAAATSIAPPAGALPEAPAISPLAGPAWAQPAGVVGVPDELVVFMGNLLSLWWSLFGPLGALGPLGPLGPLGQLGPLGMLGPFGPFGPSSV